MPLDETREAILARARELYEARDYAGLVLLLSPLRRAELVAAAELGFLLADAWQRTGDRAAALALLEELEPACARRGNDRLSRNVVNLQGVVLFGLGKLAEAERAWRRLMSASSRAEDENFVARSNNNLGVIYTLLGDRVAALVSYGRAITAYQRLGYLRGLAQAHQNKAITYREMDHWREAEHHFQRAIDYATADGSPDEVARAKQERALLLCYEGERRLAEVTARHALSRWEQLGDPAGIGDTRRVLGTVALADQRLAMAEQEAGQALAIAHTTHNTLLEAEIHELLAAVEGARAGGAAGESHLARADELFASMGAERWGAQLRDRLRRLAAA
jgi:tetratricopeptide (TPR) repeat protein